MQDRRYRRDAEEEEESVTTVVDSETTDLVVSDTMENFTVNSTDRSSDWAMNSTDDGADWMANSTVELSTPRPIPEKSRHLYLEIVAAVDSLILNDLRALLNTTEAQTIDILKLYYVHIFMGVEQIYRQSLLHETLDVHIRLSKIIFATDKHRLPWESFKNISSLTADYRKSPNNMTLRPNVSMSLLKSLHQAYASDKFDAGHFIDDADHVVTFTRVDLIGGAGSAFVMGACLPPYKYSIVQEDLNAFFVLLTVAHELGHNLGFDHDETENNCNDPTVRYVMSPKNMNSVNRPQVTYFSPCSVDQLIDFVSNTTTQCWKNPIISTRNDTNLTGLREIIGGQLGQIINVHQQCQLQYGPQSVPYISVTYEKNQTLYEENFCKELRCFKKPEDEYMYWQDGAFDGRYY